MLHKIYLIILAILFANPVFATNIMLEEMTWQEVANAIKEGKNTVIIPTGGTEQTGLHIVLGKHNYILGYTAPKIAENLGNALVAPIIKYVPEGDFNPPTGHLKFSGTLSLRPETFAAILEDSARSLKQHGFKIICFVGEHGASQAVQAKTAAKLNAEWSNEKVKVIHVNEYYDEHNGQIPFAKSLGFKEADIEAHGGIADTSEMLFAYKQGVRERLIGDYKPSDMEKIGVDGSAIGSNSGYGEKFLELKIASAVKQIKQEQEKFYSPVLQKIVP